MNASAVVNMTPHHHAAVGTEETTFVTLKIEDQLFGISVKYVRDVLRPQSVTQVPLAPPEVSGSLNLRGRIVTVIDVHRRLGLPQSGNGSKARFVVVEIKGELYSLMVDSVGEVLTVPAAAVEKAPPNLHGSWKDVASGIYKLEKELLILIDVHALLNLS